ncbi:NUDIX domain-containing protein [Celerinatantimonas yamalensis]|uniref:GDP-mannose pyrophosphatase n=1 Tax=Celerinatantimonas yamalensis TaxID=559956 RepID=A0ABW9G3B2_9GAMM
MAWQTKSSQVVFENSWLRVEDRDVINPAGHPTRYGVVHFKNRAVGVVAMTDDRQVYLVGQSRYPLASYSWEIPEGGCPNGEALEVAALRELSEETGLKAAHLQPLLTLHLSNSVTDEQAHLYLATGLTQGEQHLEESEDITVRCVAFSEALAMIDQGLITDAITVAALLAVDRQLCR